MGEVDRRIRSADCLLRIRGHLPTLRPSERRVARHVLAHPSESVGLSASRLALLCGVSAATVIKFSQSIGYAGYQELKISLAIEIGQNPRVLDLDPGDDPRTVKQKVIAKGIRAVVDTGRTLTGPALARAAHALAAANRIHFYGLGASGLVAVDAQQKFLTLNRQCHAFVDHHVQTAIAALLGRGDVAIGISHSGFTPEVIQAVKVARRGGATTICVTNHVDAPLAQAAAVCLLTAADASFFRSAATVSRAAQLCVVDILFAAVARSNAKLWA